jgi:hypothetical protein
MFPLPDFAFAVLSLQLGQVLYNPGYRCSSVISNVSNNQGDRIQVNTSVSLIHYDLVQIRIRIAGSRSDSTLFFSGLQDAKNLCFSKFLRMI